MEEAGIFIFLKISRERGIIKSFSAKRKFSILFFKKYFQKKLDK